MCACISGKEEAEILARKQHKLPSAASGADAMDGTGSSNCMVISLVLFPLHGMFPVVWCSWHKFLCFVWKAKEDLIYGLMIYKQKTEP